MATSDLEERLLELLSSEKPCAVALVGAWGVGKTHFWNSFLPRLAGVPTLSKRPYCYISMLDQPCVSEIYPSLFSNALPIEDAARGSSLQTLEKQAEGLEDAALRSQEKKTAPSAVLRFFRKHLDVAQKAPWISTVAPLYRAMTRIAIKDYIVCFDDLERRAESLSFPDMLSLVSALVEHRGCKVVAILNRDSLTKNDQEAFERLRDKVFEVELEYAPSPAQAAKIAFGGSRYGDVLGVSTIRLGIRNIRILRRIARTLDYFVQKLPQAPESIRNQLALSAVVAAWSFYGEKEGAPPFDYVRALGFSNFLESRNETEENTKQRLWMSRLSEVEYSATDKLDRYVFSYVETGFVDSESLRLLVDEMAQLEASRERRAAFNDAWALLYSSFSDNEQALVERLAGTFGAAAASIEPGNVDSTIRLLRELGHETLASRLIEEWVETASGVEEFVGRRAEYYLSEIKDTELQSRYSAILRRSTDRPKLEDVLERIGSGSGWNGEDEASLASFSVEEVCEFLRTTESRNLSSWVLRGLRFGHHGNATEQQLQISRTFSEALRRISKTSKLNELRVKRLGIKANPPPNAEAGDLE